MATKKKFYVTTAIDYPNAEPHIGHAYQKLVADALARWHKLRGEDVWFLTGTDEHGKKIQECAEKQGKKPREFVDFISGKFKEAWKSLNIDYNRFIRTTDRDHEKLVQEVIRKCNKNGDIYKGFYEGYYCVGCEAYYTEKDLVNGCCPLHNRPIEKLKEESYFFKLSKYQKFLLDLYKKNPSFVLPDERRNEIIARVSEGLKDLSISRTSFSWGIPFPLDKKHIVYVWFDALFNYLSGAGKNQEYWPANLHLLGKDNGWFHAVYWPAFLKSAGYELPGTVFIHGFLSFNGQKISKSLGNAISPKCLAEKYGTDSVRYFVLRQFPFAEGEDGDFSERALVERNNSELADKLGNLISRVAALAEKHGLEATRENKLLKKLKLREIESKVENYELDKALNLIFEFIDECNLYVQTNKIWESGDKKKLYELADSIKAISILLWPFIPSTGEKIAKQFGFKLEYSGIKKPLKVNKITKGEILFKKIEQKVNKADKIEGVMSSGEIKYTDVRNAQKSRISEHPENLKGNVDFPCFEKLDLRVAQIKKVEDIGGADKLYKLTVDVGELGVRTICAGIKKFYKAEQLKNKKIVVIANLEPRVLKGIESKGMLLAASSSGHEKVVLLGVDSDIPSGSKIS